METLSEEIAHLRHEYAAKPFNEDGVAANPVTQFNLWFREAAQSEQLDPEAMTLSTATPDGRVSARIVLLKGCDERGFVFFSNYDSRKSQEMAGNPRIALTFFWPALHRQVRIEGQVEKTTAEESDVYFQTRPRGSQLGAWASPQSQPIRDRGDLESQLAEVEARFANQPIPCPPFWGGFRLKPEQIEFWQGRENRLHDRILYTLHNDLWQIARLAP